MGGPGDYDLEEGTGADRFVLNTGGGSGRVTDFQDGLDRIQIGIGAELFTVLSDECEPVSVCPTRPGRQAAKSPRHSARAAAREAL